MVLVKTVILKPKNVDTYCKYFEDTYIKHRIGSNTF